MACFLLNKSNVTLNIPKVEDLDKVSFYLVSIKVGNVSWTVEHRYSDFVTLHDTLVTDHCVAKDILPPKKIIGKRDPAFVEKRRLGLEIYLRSVVSFLQETMPRSLAIFLDFNKYDILFLLQEMSSLFLKEGDVILSNSKHYKFNPLQVHAISERLKQPCPPAEIFDRVYDFSHVLDFCSQLESAEVEGSWGTIGSSDIVPNSCDFDLSALKNLKELFLKNVSVERLNNAGTLRQTLVKLTVTQCRLQSLVDILLCDDVHKECSDDFPDEKKWLKLEEADFSQNNLKDFGTSLSLMPNIKKLVANENHITEFDNFTSLHSLSHLYLSGNRIGDSDNLSLHFENIVHLDLSQNLISSMKCFSGLSSLEGLDLGSNIVSEINELQHIKPLEKLSYLVLNGNPVSTVVDYRIKVLENFGRRAANVCLDNEKPSQKELDTVAVILALRVVKEGKTPTFSRTIEPTFPNAPQ